MAVARGVDFLETWVSGSIPPMPTGDTELVKMMAQKLRDDADAAGLTVDDLEIEGGEVEQFIRETLLHIAEPGTSGD